MLRPKTGSRRPSPKRAADVHFLGGKSHATCKAEDTGKESHKCHRFSDGRLLCKDPVQVEEGRLDSSSNTPPSVSALGAGGPQPHQSKHTRVKGYFASFAGFENARKSSKSHRGKNGADGAFRHGVRSQRRRQAGNTERSRRARQRRRGPRRRRSGGRRQKRTLKQISCAGRGIWSLAELAQGARSRTREALRRTAAPTRGCPT